MSPTPQPAKTMRDAELKSEIAELQSYLHRAQLELVRRNTAARLARESDKGKTQ